MVIAFDQDGNSHTLRYMAHFNWRACVISGLKFKD